MKDTRGYAALFLYRKVRQGPTPEPVFIAGPAMDLPDVAVTVCLLLCHSSPAWDLRLRSRACLLLTSEPRALMLESKHNRKSLSLAVCFTFSACVLLRTVRVTELLVLKPACEFDSLMRERCLRERYMTF